jgi:hypothetical protein
MSAPTTLLPTRPLQGASLGRSLQTQERPEEWVTAGRYGEQTEGKPRPAPFDDSQPPRLGG